MSSGRELSVVIKRIRRYMRQAEILRQIHSDKASRAQKANAIYLGLTVVAAAVVTLLGFAGPDRLASQFVPHLEINVDLLQASFNWAVLAIVTLTVLGLIVRFNERRSEHQRSIEKLTEFLRDSEDLVELGEAGQLGISSETLAQIRERYKGIIATLPPSSDREYLRSKKRYKKKREQASLAAETGVLLLTWVDANAAAGKIEEALAQKLLSLLSIPWKLEVLKTVRNLLGSEYWIVGGFVRDPVWDDFNGFPLPTPLEDIDVIYFDPQASGSHESRSRDILISAVPNQIWSVTNEARGHLIRGEEPYASIEDAVSRFPETASCIAIRLTKDSSIEIVAPYGLGDLFDGIVRVSPNAAAEQYEDRLRTKSWPDRWPKLQIAESGPAR